MKKALSLLFISLLLILSACGGSESAAGTGGRFQDADLDEDGNIVIRQTDITENASFINYDADGVTVQFLAIRDGGGNVRLGYNTCQSCSPSPRAYFAQSGERLVCQNCGLSFTAENVGAGGYSCNPAAVSDAVWADETVTIPASSALAAANRFVNWQGPTA